MDGQPLRYRLTDDGHFVLYSVGLDCVDDGGQMPLRDRRGMSFGGPGGYGIQPEMDLVWPRPASADEAKANQEENQ